MLLFQRFVVKNVLMATLLVILILMTLVFITTLLGEFQDIGRGDYNFFQAIIYVFMRLPHYLYQFSPMIILLGVIVGLGLFTSQQELMIIRCSGFSTQKIIMTLLMAALLLASVFMSIGEGLAPTLDHNAAIRKQNAENNGQAVATGSGIWLHESNNFFHVERVINNKHLEGITIYQFDQNHQLLSANYTKTMEYIDNHWLMHQVSKTYFITPSNTKTSYSENEVSNFNLNPNLLTMGMIEPEAMSLSHILRFTHHLKKNGLQANQYLLSFWQRAFQPLAILIMVLLAAPFAISKPRNTLLGLRIVMGIVIGFAFYILNSMFGQSSIIFQFSPLIAAMAPVVIFFDHSAFSREKKSGFLVLVIDFIYQNSD